MEPRGFTAGSRGLSASDTPGLTRYASTLEGSQQTRHRHIASCCHPSGVNTKASLSGGVAIAQPPATRWHPFGMKCSYPNGIGRPAYGERAEEAIEPGSAEEARAKDAKGRGYEEMSHHQMGEIKFFQFLL